MTVANCCRSVRVLRAEAMPVAGDLIAFPEAADEIFAPTAVGAESSNLETDETA
jgi:hypothetical protein